ncbi:hypothetical protein CA13_56830 [Planctomycetes bacterium CA13]|uniref:Uncharacterized protein n=1 Tax=Novipirellula herctigrandis TaxID=2527986 RepID=A0A5C5ZAS8_9BACT|nr:hypothetical protein CA13_56830 [Planctomycetes bacterium CA13]
MTGVTMTGVTMTGVTMTGVTMTGVTMTNASDFGRWRSSWNAEPYRFSVIRTWRSCIHRGAELPRRQFPVC